MNLMAILLMIHRIIVKDAAIGIISMVRLGSINFILSYRVLTTMTHTEEHGCWKWSMFVMTVSSHCLQILILSYAQNTSCLIGFVSPTNLSKFFNNLLILIKTFAGRQQIIGRANFNFLMLSTTIMSRTKCTTLLLTWFNVLFAAVGIIAAPLKTKIYFSL